VLFGNYKMTVYDEVLVCDLCVKDIGYINAAWVDGEVKALCPKCYKIVKEKEKVRL
jgi:hypothetical protein